MEKDLKAGTRQRRSPWREGEWKAATLFSRTTKFDLYFCGLPLAPATATATPNDERQGAGRGSWRGEEVSYREGHWHYPQQAG